MSTTLKEKEKEILEFDIMNKIHNVDCLEFMKQIPDNYFDLVLTDPPYGMQFNSNYREKKHKKIHNDGNLDWLDGFMVELSRVFNHDGHGYIFCSWHFVDKFKVSIEKSGMNIKNILIWEKNNTGMGDLFGDYAPKYEMCIFISNGERKLNGGRDENILKGNRTSNKYHPTQKPLKLFEYLLTKSKNDNSKVFDPFMGSGTTAIACKSLGLEWCGCELEAEYVDIANKRLEQVQGILF